MTKNYLGYGYTNSRGVARLQYNPNDEQLTQSGYKNTHTNNTQITAQITHKNKTYTSNTKQYNGITEQIIFQDNQTTNKTNSYNIRATGTITYHQNEYLQISDSSIATRRNATINNPINTSDNIIFEADIYAVTSIGWWAGLVILKDNKDTLCFTLGTDIRELINDSNKFVDYLNGTYSPNQWYHMKLELNNGNFILSIYSEDTLIETCTHQIPSEFESIQGYIGFNLPSENDLRVRNVKLQQNGG